MIRTIKQLIPKSFNMNKLEKSEPIIVMPLVVKGSLSASFESDEDTMIDNTYWSVFGCKLRTLQKNS